MNYSRHPLLAEIDPDVRGDVSLLLADAELLGTPMVILTAYRTESAQAAALASGASEARHPMHPIGRAVDLMHRLPSGARAWCLCGADHTGLGCPRPGCEAATDAAREALGEGWEARGHRWGGRWRRPHDPLHFEVPLPSGADYARAVRRYRDLVTSGAVVLVST